MISVVWIQSALDDLASAWIAASSDERFAITKASAEIDRRLAKNPHLEGESRSHALRITFALPLAVTFHFDSLMGRVTVARVRVFRKKRPS